MDNRIEEFANSFFQEISNEADSRPQFNETVFFERFCDSLVEAGELDVAERADYKSPSREGVRVDGYGGSPDEAAGVLSLIIANYRQSPNLERLSKTEMDQAFSRLLRFVKKSLDPNWRNALEETGPGYGLAELIAQRWEDVSHIRFILITNRILSDRVDGREAGEFDGRQITYSVWDIGRLMRFETSQRDREELEIDLERDYKALPILSAHLGQSEYKAYLAVVPGKLLASIYDRWGTRLLEQNVRVFLQARGNVNKGIKNTIERSPKMFFAYNNGITATAEDVKTDTRDGQLVLTQLKNFQIVNGGQTTASIHQAKLNKVDLSKVFVQMKLSIVDPEQADIVVPKISEYANSQNRVNAADFFSNHPYHRRLEEFSRRIYAPSPEGSFRQSKWFYERARGQFIDARSNLSRAERKKFDIENPSAQRFNKTDLAKYHNVWEQIPHTVSLGAQKNFAEFAKLIGKKWTQDSKQFHETYFKETVAKAIIFKRTEKIVSEQAWYQGGYRANIVAYTISKMAYDIDEMNKCLDFVTIWDSQSLSPEMEKMLASIAGKVCPVLTKPPQIISNVTEWAKKGACWDRAMKLKIKYPKAFCDGLISPEKQRIRDQEGRKDQKFLDGVGMQSMVIKGGAGFWKQVLQWGKARGILSSVEMSILQVATKLPNRIPTEKQSIVLVKALEKLQAEGLEMSLEQPNGESES